MSNRDYTPRYALQKIGTDKFIIKYNKLGSVEEAITFATEKEARDYYECGDEEGFRVVDINPNNLIYINKVVGGHAVSEHITLEYGQDGVTLNHPKWGQIHLSISESGYIRVFVGNESLVLHNFNSSMGASMKIQEPLRHPRNKI